MKTRLLLKIGILALQGAYQAHATCLTQLGVAYQWVKHPKDLASIDALILPGGESSVLLSLLQENSLFSALQSFKKPILGTCAGAILLAQTVESPSQASLGHIAMTITRNAYGRQLASHISMGTWQATSPTQPLEIVLIRAPIIRSLDASTVKVLVTDNHGHPVGVQQGCYLAMCFHPELSDSTLVHQYFLGEISP